MNKPLIRLLHLLVILGLLNASSPGISLLWDAGHSARPLQPVQTVYTSEALSPELLSPLKVLFFSAKVHLYQSIPAVILTVTPVLPILAAFLAGSHDVSGLLFGMMPAPPDSWRLIRMKSDAMAMVHRHRDPETVPTGAIVDQLMNRYFSFGHFLNEPDERVRDHLLQAEEENHRFRDWLRDNPDLRLRVLSADLQTRYLQSDRPRIESEHRETDRDALHTLKTFDDRERLFLAAFEASDAFAVAGAIDTLQELGAVSELKTLKKDWPLAMTAVLLEDMLASPYNWEHLPVMITVLARLGMTEKLNELRQNPLVLKNLAGLLRIDDAEMAGWAFGLLADQASPATAEQFLNKLKSEIPKSDTYFILGMLATLRVMAGTPTLASVYPSALVQSVQREITRTSWTAENVPAELADFGYMAHRVGQLLHRNSEDMAIRHFTANLFEVAFLQAMEWSVDPLLWSHISMNAKKLLAQSQAEGGKLKDSELAAITQYFVVLQAGFQGVSAQGAPWIAVYRDAVSVETHADSSLSLSELAKHVIAQHLKNDETEIVAGTTRPREEDRKTKEWQIYIPGADTHASVPQTDAILRNLPERKKMTYTGIRRQFRDYFSRLVSDQHINLSVDYMIDRWPAIKAFMQGVAYQAKPSYVEWQVTELCNLACLFCKGEIRDIPEKETTISIFHLLKTLSEIFELNPKAFHRISGTIGEPLMVPGIMEFFKMLNKFGAPWGITTNGLLMHRKGVVDEFLRADYVHVSLDAGSDETYVKLKRGRPGDYEKVISNIEKLIEARRKAREEGLPVKTQIYVSFLLQSQNYLELEVLSARLKTMGVDGIQVKMQHYDSRRGMTEQEVNITYDEQIAIIKKRDEDYRYKVMIMQEKPVALFKILGEAGAMAFDQCAVSLLGNVTIGPGGLEGTPGATVWACCNNFDRTIGNFGHTLQNSFTEIWRGAERQKKLLKSPRINCQVCAPTDWFLNSFMDFMKKAYAFDPTFLEFAEEIVFGYRNWERRNMSPILSLHESA